VNDIPLCDTKTLADTLQTLRGLIQHIDRSRIGRDWEGCYVGKLKIDALSYLVNTAIAQEKRRTAKE